MLGIDSELILVGGFLLLIILSLVFSQTILPTLPKVPHRPNVLFPSDLTCPCELLSSVLSEALLRVLLYLPEIL